MGREVTLARHAHKIGPLVATTGETEPGPTPLRVARSGQTGVDPVGGLQMTLGRAFRTTSQDRWSPLSTSIFLLAVCGTFWSLVALALLNARP